MSFNIQIKDKKGEILQYQCFVLIGLTFSGIRNIPDLTDIENDDSLFLEIIEFMQSIWF